ANMAGILGGWLVAVYSAHIAAGVFWNSASQMLTWREFVLGLSKTLVFGAIIAVVGCDQGLRTTGGAAGVGRATTASVVLSIVLIYAADYFLSAMLFGTTGAGG